MRIVAMFVATPTIIIIIIIIITVANVDTRARARRRTISPDAVLDLPRRSDATFETHSTTIGTTATETRGVFSELNVLASFHSQVLIYTPPATPVCSPSRRLRLRHTARCCTNPCVSSYPSRRWISPAVVPQDTADRLSVHMCFIMRLSGTDNDRAPANARPRIRARGLAVICL